MWDLPRPGFEPVFPALAGRFSTTAPPGKPHSYILKRVTVMPANIRGGVQEELMNQAKISNKEDDIILMTKRTTYYGISVFFVFLFFAFMCYFTCISKQTNKTAKSGFLLREIFLKTVWERVESSKKYRMT